MLLYLEAIYKKREDTQQLSSKIKSKCTINNVYLQSSSILKILIFFNQLHSTYKVTILP